MAKATRGELRYWIKPYEMKAYLSGAAAANAVDHLLDTLYSKIYRDYKSESVAEKIYEKAKQDFYDNYIITVKLERRK